MICDYEQVNIANHHVLSWNLLAPGARGPSSRRDGSGCIIRDSYRAGNLLSLGYAHL